MKTLSLIGAGRMAEALVGGLLSQRTLAPENIIATDIDPERRRYFQTTFKVEVGETIAAVRDARFILIAVKPQQIQSVISELAGAVLSDQVVISIAAGVTVERIRGILGPKVPVIRVMPNTPALVNKGISALVLPEELDHEAKEFARSLFRAVGEIVEVKEDAIDAVTAVSGSGPAYFFLFVKELAAAGVAAGLSAGAAEKLARDTFFGSAALLEKTIGAGSNEADLIRAVASPGGTTEAALASFKKERFDQVIQSAVRAAAARAKELAAE